MKQKINKYWAGFLGIFIFLALMFNLINEDIKQKMLQNSNTVVGILEREYHSSLRFNYGLFTYQIQNKKYKIEHHGDFSFLQKGDSVLIKYSITDPSVARVQDRYYMEKYKRMRK